MHNDSTRISANEINRYVYCNYQWYYRRLYGDKKLSELRKERNQALGIKTDSRLHAFVRGNKFHRNYNRWYKVKIVFYMLALVLLIGVVLFFTWPTFENIVKGFF